MNGTASGIGSVSGATTQTLIIDGVLMSAAGNFHFIASNSCGCDISNTATLAVCPSDFNCDSATDFFDYLDFVQAFADNNPSADFNHDSVIDFFDYLDFVSAFAHGC